MAKDPLDWIDDEKARQLAEHMYKAISKSWKPIIVSTKPLASYEDTLESFARLFGVTPISFPPATLSVAATVSEQLEPGEYADGIDWRDIEFVVWDALRERK